MKNTHYQCIKKETLNLDDKKGLLVNLPNPLLKKLVI